MIDWGPHKLWIGILSLAILVSLSQATVLGLAQHRAEAKLASVTSEKNKAVKALRQLEEDIASVERMKTEIDISETEKYLAPVDRLRAGQILERHAADSGLTHFTYTLSPEEKMPVETLAAGTQTLANSKWTLAADAPTDIDAYAFMDAIKRTMPGRLTINELSLERFGANSAISNANIRLIASGEWLSNGASGNLAEGLR